MRLHEIEASRGQELPTGMIPFERRANPGWYQDGDSITAYHGTHLRNVPDILASGLNRADPSTGMISVTLDPLTAHAYAAMSGEGGEANFRGAGARARSTPHDQRAVIKLVIPQSWAQAHMDPGLGGNVGVEDETNDLVDARTRISSRKEYDRWRRANPHLPGRVYYTGTELRFDTAIPAEFIRGYMMRSPPDKDGGTKMLGENFADGRGPGRPGDSRRHGIPRNATIAQLERHAKRPGRAGQLARWQLNMRRGRKASAKN